MWSMPFVIIFGIELSIANRSGWSACVEKITLKNMTAGECGKYGPDVARDALGPKWAMMWRTRSRIPTIAAISNTTKTSKTTPTRTPDCFYLSCFDSQAADAALVPKVAPHILVNSSVSGLQDTASTRYSDLRNPYCALGIGRTDTDNQSRFRLFS